MEQVIGGEVGGKQPLSLRLNITTEEVVEVDGWWAGEEGGGEGGGRNGMTRSIFGSGTSSSI